MKHSVLKGLVTALLGIYVLFAAISPLAGFGNSQADSSENSEMSELS